MRSREKILMQKIEKREKVKKKLSVKVAKTQSNGNEGKNFFLVGKIIFYVLSNIIEKPQKLPFVNGDKPRKQKKLIEKPDKMIKKKKKKFEKPIEPEESDQEMEEGSDDEAEEESQCRKALNQPLIVC